MVSFACGGEVDHRNLAANSSRNLPLKLMDQQALAEWLLAATSGISGG